ncbi:MAG: patatin-like phospholipase family protein, partial [Alphaproteobacteria bacterium]
MTRPLTLELLQQRKEQGSMWGQRKDPWKLCLVLESGGQAGAILGGFVSALEMLGYRDCFDGVVGCSAGAMTGAYFAAGQAAYGTMIYPEHNCDGRFLNIRRLLTTRPVMDLDYLVDETMGQTKPLDTAKLENMNMPVLAVAARRDGKRRLLTLNGVKREVVLNNMKVSARVPLWGSRKLRGHHLWDGTLVEPVPVASAVDMGATHVLVLSRRDVECSGLLDTWIEKIFYYPVLRQWAPDLHHVYRKRGQYIRYESGNAEVMVMALSKPRLAVATCKPALIWSEIRRAYRHAELVLTGYQGRVG